MRIFQSFSILHAFMELSRDDAAWKAEALDDNGRPRLW